MASVGDFEKLMKIGKQAITLQQPNLPNLETHLHLQHAHLVTNIEKKFTSDEEFPCCSCEQLLLRKQVTAFINSVMQSLMYGKCIC